MIREVEVVGSVWAYKFIHLLTFNCFLFEMMRSHFTIEALFLVTRSYDSTIEALYDYLK